MAITLDLAKPNKNTADSIETGYLYKDLNFDIRFSQPGGDELFSDADSKDLIPLYGASAIVNSLKNILTTSPGEKLLNPTFGLDLRDYLFDKINESYAYFIGQTILAGLTTQEPRINIESIDVIGIIDELQYEITIHLSIPSLKVYDLSLRGVLNNDGFNFV